MSRFRCRSITQSAIAVLALGVFFFSASVRISFSQESGEEKPAAEEKDPKEAKSSAELLRDAYEKTKTADSIDDYAMIIKSCQEAQKDDLDAANSAYAKKLLAWAHNRRGEAHSEQAAMLTEEGEADQAAELDAAALADFEAAVANDPNKWKALHNRGVSYAVIGKFEEAINDFSRAIELKPSYANAWFNRAEIRYEQSDYDAAIGDYTRAINLKPDDAGAYTSRGHAYFHLRRFEPALNDYNRAVGLQPQSAEAHANRGDAHLSLRVWSQAAKDYRRAIDLDSELGRAHQSAAWLMATCPNSRYRNPDLAVQTAERAIALDGEEDYRYLDTLAAAYANAGRYEEAKKQVEEAIALAPEDAADALKARHALYAEEQPFRQ